MQQKVIIIGAGGHAKVIADIILKNSDILLGFLDDNIKQGTNVIAEYKVIGKVKDCKEYESDTKFIIGIGNNSIREKIVENYKLQYYTAIHPNAIIGMTVNIGAGSVIMANACVNSNAIMGNHCIINTGAIVEHDNVIEDFVHISPNATLGGTVKIGRCSHIGIGATVKNNISINKNTTVGAGAVVVKDITQAGCTYIGIPAQKMEK